MKNFNLKACLPHIVALVLFIGIAVWYCSPLFEGKVLHAGDVNNWKGAAQEARLYLEETGETTWWTNSMFSGMPTYQITGSLPSDHLRKTLEDVLHLGFAGDWAPVGIILGYLIGFYLLLLCFGVSPWLALGGSVAISLSSYFFLIIPAGHITKAVGLGFLAPVVGGFYAIFRKKYCLGFPMMTLFGMVGLTLHPQMTYYMFMLIGVLACAELYIHIREQRWKDLGVGVGVLLLALALVYATKISWWQQNNEYLSETMRGGHSELVDAGDQQKNAGLDLDYATAWSYGIDETATFLIPNYMGGSSGYNVGKESVLYKELVKLGVPKKSAEGFCQQAPTYHGDKSFTSGPVYMGAIICFLFLLALLIVPGPYKWALLTATMFSVLLAWGRHLMPLTELFYHYFPMYNKFRAVESILVVAEVTMPLLAMLGVMRISQSEAADKKVLNRAIAIAGGCCAVVCVLFALLAGGMDVTSTYDESWRQQMSAPIYEAILHQRQAMISADAWRSLLFVVLAAALLLWYVNGKMRVEAKEKALYILSAGLLLLVLADMLPVDKRYFGSDSFITNKENERGFQMQPYEQQILQDNDPDCRVLNLSANTFNDARTSYRLKSIGGYSAAKLRRYQDLIDAAIVPEMNPMLQAIVQTGGFARPCNGDSIFPVLNMLNTKYVVVSMQSGEPMAVRNPYAMGHAWFVDELKVVGSPKEEMAAILHEDLHHVAVTDAEHAAQLPVMTMEIFDGIEDAIQLRSYRPNHLEYDAACAGARLAVFSEVYYREGWKLTIDGEPAPLIRVNYLLRGAMIPAGEHQVVMHFEPKATTIDKWCVAVFVLVLLLSLCALAYPLYAKKKTL